METGGPTWPTWFCQEPPTLKRVAHTSTLRAESNRPGADIHDCVSLKYLTSFQGGEPGNEANKCHTDTPPSPAIVMYTQV